MMKVSTNALIAEDKYRLSACAKSREWLFSAFPRKQKKREIRETVATSPLNLGFEAVLYSKSGGARAPSFIIPPSFAIEEHVVLPPRQETL